MDYTFAFIFLLSPSPPSSVCGWLQRQPLYARLKELHSLYTFCIKTCCRCTCRQIITLTANLQASTCQVVFIFLLFFLTALLSWLVKKIILSFVSPKTYRNQALPLYLLPQRKEREMEEIITSNQNKIVQLGFQDQPMLSQALKGLHSWLQHAKTNFFLKEPLFLLSIYLL